MYIIRLNKGSRVSFLQVEYVSNKTVFKSVVNWRKATPVTKQLANHLMNELHRTGAFLGNMELMSL